MWSRRRAVLLTALMATAAWVGLLVLFGWLTGYAVSGYAAAGFAAGIFAAQFLVLSMIAVAPESGGHGASDAGPHREKTHSATKRTSQGTRVENGSFHLGINPGSAIRPAMRRLVLENSS